MFREKVIRSLVGAALVALGTNASAQFKETEEWVEDSAKPGTFIARQPNHPIGSAQRLGISGTGLTGSASVDGVIGVPSGSAVVSDADFFSFEGKEGDVISVDIDGGIGGARSVDTMVFIFGPGPGYTMLRGNDDGGVRDAGSTSTMDSRIVNFRLPSTGVFTIGVSSFPRSLTHGGIYNPATAGTLNALSNGDYTLIISGVSLPQVLHINIDIKPGQGGAPAPINPKSKGVVPVALLGNAEFDPFKIDLKSLTFGPEGNEPSYRRCSSDPVDVNGDGRMDRVCHFDNEEAKFEKGDMEGVVKGKTTDGRQFEGRGLLKVVPEKRERQ